MAEMKLIAVGNSVGVILPRELYELTAWVREHARPVRAGVPCPEA